MSQQKPPDNNDSNNNNKNNNNNNNDDDDDNNNNNNNHFISGTIRFPPARGHTWDTRSHPLQGEGFCYNADVAQPYPRLPAL